MSDANGTQEHDREYETKFMQTAGPLTKPSRTSFFDVHGLPETPVVPPGTEMPPEGVMISIQALVNPDEPGAPSLLGVRYAPNAFVDRHKHNVAQIVVVLEGELRQGNRTFGPGQGYYTPAGAPYAVQVGPQGVKLVEFRPGWLQFTTDWVQDGGANGAEDQH
jgi:quercetin dioxygenase-like cupin family protein